MQNYTIKIQIGGGQTEEREVYGITLRHAKLRLVLARANKGLKTRFAE